MSTNAWEGRLARLRGPEPSDATVLQETTKDSEAQLAAGGAIQFPFSFEAGRRWLEEQSSKLHEGDEVQLLIETLGGELVGGLNTHHVSSRNGTFSYGISIFRRHHRKGYAADAIVLLLRHFFNERRYQKCNVTVFSFNEASIRLHESLGFIEEGRMRRAVYARRTYHDEIMFGITAEEFLERHPEGDEH